MSREKPSYWQRIKNLIANEYITLWRHDLVLLKNKVEGYLTLHEMDYLEEMAVRMKGNVLEFGAFQGLSSCVLSRACNYIDKTLYTFESFEGLDNPDEELDPTFRHGEYRGEEKVLLDNVLKHGSINNHVLIVGDATKTLPRNITDWCFAFLDMDCYSPTKEVLRILKENSKGGEVIAMHDVFSIGIRRAIVENGLRYREIPETGIGEVRL